MMEARIGRLAQEIASFGIGKDVSRVLATIFVCAPRKPNKLEKWKRDTLKYSKVKPELVNEYWDRLEASGYFGSDGKVVLEALDTVAISLMAMVAEGVLVRRASSQEDSKVEE